MNRRFSLLPVLNGNVIVGNLKKWKEGPLELILELNIDNKISTCRAIKIGVMTEIMYL